LKKKDFIIKKYVENQCNLKYFMATFLLNNIVRNFEEPFGLELVHIVKPLVVFIESASVHFLIFFIYHLKKTIFLENKRKKNKSLFKNFVKYPGMKELYTSDQQVPRFKTILFTLRIIFIYKKKVLEDKSPFFNQLFYH
jgi:hypothetical protein